MKMKVFLLLASLAVFSFAIQAQNAKSRTEPVTVGMVAPDFTLADQNGKSVTLSKSKGPVVLVFFRGYW